MTKTEKWIIFGGIAIVVAYFLYEAVSAGSSAVNGFTQLIQQIISAIQSLFSGSGNSSSSSGGGNNTVQGVTGGATTTDDPTLGGQASNGIP